MNITEAIGKEISPEVSEFLSKTPEIQVYANSNVYAYLWRDSRFEETRDMWDNPKYTTRKGMKIGLKHYLRERGDI